VDKIKIEFYKTLKEFEGTDPTTRYKIPKQKCSRKLASIITTVNQEYLKHNVTSFLELHNAIYAAAVATVKMRGARKEGKKLNHIQNKTQTPPWERRLKKQIDDLRKDIGRMQQAQNGNTSNRLQKHSLRIKKKLHVHAKHDPNNAHITEILDTLKQKLSAKSQQLRQYKEANERKQQNRLFTAKKTYYRNIKSGRRPDCQNNLPDKQALTAFWESIWGNAFKHNLKASWIRREQARVSDVTAMEHSPITTEQVSRLIAKTLIWKTLGPDGTSNFWIKRFTATHLFLAHYFNQFMEDAGNIPDFLVQGITYLLAKS
jgi:hypothetical protein